MESNHIKFWELIASKLHGELDPDEKILFEKGLEDEQNEKLFASGERIHSGLKEARLLEKAGKENSWNNIEKQVRSEKAKFYIRSILKYAAILVVAFVSGLVFHSVYKNSTEKIQYTEIEVMFGQTSHMYLFDGTEVWLNSGTKFRYPNKFNQNERNVFIEGEAFFKVAPNKNLPFKVKAGDLEVEVLGTSFNVSAYKDETEESVVLVEGKVQINNMEGEKIGEILPGQMAVKSRDDDRVQVQNTDPYFYTSWKDGKVIFTAEKLGEIARKMERWYNVEIRFENESLKDYRFTGTILRNKPIDQTILAIELLAPLRFQYQVRANEKNVITIIKR